MPVIGSAIYDDVALISYPAATAGTLYELTDNLSVPILVHAVYNVILLLISYVTVTGV